MPGAKRKPGRAAPPDQLELVVANRQRARALNTPLMREMAHALLKECLGITTCQLGVYLVSAKQIAHINEKFLGHAGPTDVIAFDYTTPDGQPARAGKPSRSRKHILWGDVLICVDEAVRQAPRFNTTWQAELVRYLVHGVLHLLGHDDHTPTARRKMKNAEARLLRQISRRFALADLERAD
ncbi:MAG: rRNA maturation RNase YbeY [Verrucomicrobiales bacterium]|nr:rRNA maturation RNase YbeY [Verrucomicrobiales bacterium]